MEPSDSTNQVSCDPDGGSQQEIKEAKENLQHAVASLGSLCEVNSTVRISFSCSRNPTEDNYSGVIDGVGSALTIYHTYSQDYVSLPGNLGPRGLQNVFCDTLVEVQEDSLSPKQYGRFGTEVRVMVPSRNVLRYVGGVYADV